MQRRSNWIGIWFVLGTLALTGCTSRGTLAPIESGVYPVVPQANIHTIFVASSRKFATEKTEQRTVYLTHERATSLNFAKLAVSVPPVHQPGKIEWASGTANPQKNFALVGDVKFKTENTFVAQLNAALARKHPRDQSIFVFVHGFNNNFAESLFRLAQLKNDADINAVTVSYSWPSRGKSSRYAYDRDSVAFSRDQLDHLLEMVAKTRTRKIYILAHSLGSWLTMEALRQKGIAGKKPLLNKLSALALAAPDIDVEVFKTQIKHIKPKPSRFFVMKSDDDDALDFLKYFTGGTERVGEIRDYTTLSKFGITVCDLSKFKQGDGLGHSTFATSPGFLKLFRGWVARASGRRPRDKNFEATAAKVCTAPT